MSSSSEYSDRNSIPGDSYPPSDQEARPPNALRLTRSCDTAVRVRQAFASLPDIQLRAYPELRARRLYGDQYADTYSDSESDDDGHSPTVAAVMAFERGAAKQPAVRVGAARLGEMIYAHRRGTTAAAEEREAPAPEEEEYEDLDTPDPAVPVQRGGTVRRKGTYKGREEPPTCAEPASERAASAAASLHYGIPPQEWGEAEGDEFNGLLAPGAHGDEKQRARADGGKLQRLAQRLRGDGRAEREARQFRPTVFDPTRKRGPGTTDALVAIDDNSRRGRFPFCCCAPRYCVAFGFVSVLLFAILGFFAWPRVPSISISSLSALEPATVTYDEAGSAFGLRMPLRVTYEIHSGNFYPLTIARVHVAGFDGVTGNKIIDTALAHIYVPPLHLQFHAAPAALHYLTSDMSDPALTDLFSKCAPRSATNATKGIEGRPGPLTIRFQLKVDVSRLGWLKQPVVTLNQNIECPE
ncbi:hypothetical protein FBU31_000516 [Coemansia sp. 'formosensis']|nr:hypothetical protein FBU31_000516 [Coemansia sp. 'formosensis']